MTRYSLPPRGELHHHVVNAFIPECGVDDAGLVVIVGVDVDEQARLLVGVGEHPRVPNRVDPVGVLVLQVVCGVVRVG